MSWQARSKIISTRRKQHSAGKTKVVRENTYLREPQNQLPTRPASKWTWLLFLLPFIIVGLFYYLSGLLISSINIPATKNINPAEIKQIFEEQKKEPVLLVFDQSNLLLFNSGQFIDKLNARYQFHSLKLKKNWHDLSLNLVFEEKDYDLVWQEGEEYYFINYDGDIIVNKNTNSTSTLGDLLSVLNRAESKKEGRKIIVDEKYLRSASALNEALKMKTKGLSSRRIALGKEYNTLQVLVLNGPIIYFNIDADIDMQLAKLEALRKADLADGQVFNRQKYIDLRYGKSVFYQ